MKVVKKEDIYYCWKVNFEEPIPSWIYKNFRITYTKSGCVYGIGGIPASIRIDDKTAETNDYVMSKDLEEVIVIKERYFSDIFEVYL